MNSVHIPHPPHVEVESRWFKTIPLGWQFKRLKWEIDRNDGGVWGSDPTGTDDTIVLRSTEQAADGSWKIDEPAYRKISSQEKDKSILKAGDLLVTKSSGSELHIGKTSLVSESIEKMGCCYSNFMQRLRLKKTLLPKFCWYFMNNDLARSQFNFLSNTTTGLSNLNSEIFGALTIPCPPIDEQLLIINFLDAETAKIDNLICKQEELVDYLIEKCESLISESVLHGIDKAVDTKNSGIEWIGSIPSHWKISRFCYETWVRARLGWKGLKAEEYVEDGYIFLATPNIKNSEIDFENVNYISPERYEESPEIMLNVGDILLAKDGSTLGTVNLVRHLPKPATVNSSIAVITPNKNLDSEYLFYIFKSGYMKNIIQMLKGGMGVPHLFQGDINKIYLPIPPLAEQKRICAFLSPKINKIDELIDKSKTSLVILKERRSSLISALVTGKIDVRNFS